MNLRHLMDPLNTAGFLVIASIPLKQEVSSRRTPDVRELDTFVLDINGFSG